MLAVARAFAARGHAVTIYTSVWQGEKPPGITVVEVLVQARTNHGRNLGFVRRFAERRVGADGTVVIGFNKMPGLDFYYAADSCFAEKAYSQRSFFYRILPRSQSYLQFEQAVFGEQEKTRALLIAPAQRTAFQQYYRTPDARLYLLPPGISRACVNEDGARIYALHDELGLAHDKKIALFVGSGFRTKGLDRAIAAIDALPPALRHITHLAIAGRDNATAFEKQAKQAGLEKQVHFLGGRNDVAQLMKSADVLLHPARREAAGLVLLEASVACLPILVTDVCGHAHYISEHDLGIVLPSPFSQQQLNHALVTMLSDIPQANIWRVHGRQFAKTADIYSMPERFVEYVESCQA